MMISDSRQPLDIRIGLLDTTLGARRSAPEREPVVATVRDIGELLTGFQQAIYATYTMENERDDVRQLSRAERERYALQIVGFERSSFLAALAASPGIDPMTVFLLVTSTVQTIAAFIAIVQSLRSTSPQQSTPSSRLSDRENLILRRLKWPANSLAEVGLRSNHVLQVQLGNLPPFRLDIGSCIAIHQYAGHASRTRDVPRFESTHEYIISAIVAPPSDDRPLRLQSPRYKDPIPCSFGPDYREPQDAFVEGATVSVEGVATRLRGDPPDSAPIHFQIDRLLDGGSR